MNGCAVSALFLLHYGTHRVVATPHFSERRVQTRGKRSRATLVAAACHNLNWAYSTGMSAVTRVLSQKVRERRAGGVIGLCAI
jgi:hypothetical protein